MPGQENKGAYICQDITFPGEEKASPIPPFFPSNDRTLNDISVTKLDHFAANADGLIGNAQATGQSRMGFFVMRPAKS